MMESWAVLPVNPFVVFGSMETRRVSLSGIVRTIPTGNNIGRPSAKD